MVENGSDVKKILYELIKSDVKKILYELIDNHPLWEMTF